MEWATLVVDLLKTWAWPVVVLILGLKARPLLQGVIDRVKRIKAGGNEFELADIPKPQIEAPKEPQPEQKALPPPKATPPQLEPEQPAPAEPDLVTYAPEGAVIQAWGRFEETLRKEAIRLGLTDPTKRSLHTRAGINLLQRAGVIADDRAEQANKLLKIRNEVAHGARVTHSAASQFVATTESLIRDIEAYADIIQLRRIFEQLHVDYTNQDQVRKICVGRLAATGDSADEEAAAEMARGRLGKWAARADGVIMAVTERDAALLLARGAQLGDPEAED